MLIPDGYAQVNFQFSGAAAPTGAEITMGVDLDAFTGDANSCASLSIVNAGALLTSSITSSLVLTGCLVKFGPNATGPQGLASGSAAGTGSTLGSPPMVAILVKKVTAEGGRTSRGRFFMPGLMETSVDQNGQLLAATVTAYQTAVNAFKTAMEADNLPLVLLHAEGSPASIPDAITALVVDSKSATQRRRNRR